MRSSSGRRRLRPGAHPRSRSRGAIRRANHLMAPVPSAERPVGARRPAGHRRTAESLSFLRFISICPPAAATSGPFAPRTSITVNRAARCPATAIRSEDRSVVAALCVDPPFTRVGARARRRWWLLPAHLHAGTDPWSGSITMRRCTGLLLAQRRGDPSQLHGLGAPARRGAPVLPVRGRHLRQRAHAMSDRRVDAAGPWRVRRHGGAGAPARLEFQIASNVALAGCRAPSAASDVAQDHEPRGRGPARACDSRGLRPTRVRGS